MRTQLLSTSPCGISLYELSNPNGMRVQVLDYGARLAAIYVPTASGQFVDVLAGYPNPDDFMGDNPYFNAVIGRVANRIDRATFSLDGKTYRLNANDGHHHLHGGKVGFDRRMWQVVALEDGAITMQYMSPDGEENYPGALTVRVTYRLGADNSLSLVYHATTTRATPINLTNHAYFNLDGDFDSVLGHTVQIDADRVLLADAQLIPHGAMPDVTGTIYDFRCPRAIGRYLTPHKPPVTGQGGYDIAYVLRPHAFETPVATATAAHSGVRMTVYTDRSCLQFYTGNFLDGSISGKKTYGYQSAFCMETQDYSNAPNEPAFPSVVLRPDQSYDALTVYRFDVIK